MDKEILKEFKVVNDKINAIQQSLDSFAFNLYKENADEIYKLTYNNVDLLYEISLIELGIQGE